MNREFKFRAFSEVSGMNSWEKMNASHYSIKSLISSHRWVVMQYSGFDDQDGTCIYEGDILTYDTGKSIGGAGLHVKYCGVLKWLKYGWGFTCHENGKDLIFNLNGNYWFGRFDSRRFKVIGNVFECPEMLSRD